MRKCVRIVQAGAAPFDFSAINPEIIRRTRWSPAKSTRTIWDRICDVSDGCRQHPDLGDGFVCQRDRLIELQFAREIHCQELGFPAGLADRLVRIDFKSSIEVIDRVVDVGDGAGGGEALRQIDFAGASQS
jgi:hypothetical protein